MAQIKLSEVLKLSYTNCEQIILLETQKIPIMLVYLGIYLLYAIWDVADDPFLKFWVLNVWKYLKMAK